MSITALVPPLSLLLPPIFPLRFNNFANLFELGSPFESALAILLFVDAVFQKIYVIAETRLQLTLRQFLGKCNVQIRISPFYSRIFNGILD